jgi:prevent-host-death family protein
MSATDFKAKCLGILDEVQSGRGDVIITKRGKPVARLVPAGPIHKSLRGIWKGGRILGEIVHNDWSYLFDVLKK